MKSKTFKIIKIILIVFLALIVVSVSGGIIVYNVFFKEQVEEIITMVDDVIESGELFEEIDQYIEATQTIPDSPASEPTENTVEPTQSNTQPSDNIVPQFSTGGTAEAINNEAKKNFENPLQNKTTAPAPEQVADSQIVKAPEKKSASDYDSQYEYIKDNVSASDFTTGSNLASRIDVGYVLGLLSGGLTSAEKKELKAYLNAHFSASEIQQGIALYSKYSHLLR